MFSNDITLRIHKDQIKKKKVNIIKTSYNLNNEQNDPVYEVIQSCLLNTHVYNYFFLIKLMYVISINAIL